MLLAQTGCCQVCCQPAAPLHPPCLLCQPPPSQSTTHTHLISKRSQVLVPSPQGDLRVVMRSTLVGRRTGPFTLSCLSLAPFTRSADTAGGRGSGTGCEAEVCREHVLLPDRARVAPGKQQGAVSSRVSEIARGFGVNCCMGPISCAPQLLLQSTLNRGFKQLLLPASASGMRLWLGGRAGAYPSPGSSRSWRSG